MCKAKVCLSVCLLYYVILKPSADMYVLVYETNFMFERKQWPDKSHVALNQ